MHGALAEPATFLNVADMAIVLSATVTVGLVVDVWPVELSGHVCSKGTGCDVACMADGLNASTKELQQVYEW